MLVAYRAQRWDEASELLGKLRLNGHANQTLYDLYEERITEYRANPPVADWDGAYVASTK
jgi:adenylate cyclase